jgi:rare lipoprotein A
MQTKLRILGWMFVVSLLWTSPMSAAIAKANTNKNRALQAPKPRYVGVASWYGADRQGQKMANGKKFDRQALTAACWFYPLGTSLRVVNLTNGNAVTVTVTDRGPNLRLNRVVDLSEAAARQLGYLDQGLTKVFVLPSQTAGLEHAEIESELVDPSVGKPVLAADASPTDMAN